ncbi:MAG: hypothetical protein LBT43_19340 [Prevotella sp.]|jgi:hypothetical protein|nr:hypothetical protein [Prevotella sp.]
MIRNDALPFQTAAEIPAFFTNPCLEDITEKYVVCKDADVILSGNENRKFAYLCCYNPDNQTWIPVHWAEIKHNKALFEDMGINVLYFPAYYINGTMTEAGYPFILLADGSKQILKADRMHTVTAELYSKVPYRSHIKFYAEILKGSSIGIANRVDLSDSVRLHKIEHTPFYRQEITAEQTKPARYAYFHFADKRYGFLVELSFWGIDGQGRKIELNGKPFGNPGLSGNEINKAFDNDRVSFFFEDIFSKEYYVGVDFGKPVVIKKIMFWPRSDDNAIVPGEEYELFYWEQGWQSLGRQTGHRDCKLVYGNVPDNALLRIHNHTRGKEHRPFTYENGKQVWW